MTQTNPSQDRPTYGVREQADGRWYVVNEQTGERQRGLSHPNRESAQADADA